MSMTLSNTSHTNPKGNNNLGFDSLSNPIVLMITIWMFWVLKTSTPTPKKKTSSRLPIEPDSADDYDMDVVSTQNIHTNPQQ